MQKGYFNIWVYGNMEQEIFLSKYGRELAKNRTINIRIGLRKQEETLSGDMRLGGLDTHLPALLQKTLIVVYESVSALAHTQQKEPTELLKLRRMFTQMFTLNP